MVDTPAHQPGVRRPEGPLAPPCKQEAPAGTSLLRTCFSGQVSAQVRKAQVDFPSRKPTPTSREALPSAVPDRPSALKLLVLFFLRCFFLLAWGEGGGSSLGLVVLDMLGLEHTESPSPVSASDRKGKTEQVSALQTTKAAPPRAYQAPQVTCYWNIKHITQYIGDCWMEAQSTQY